MLVVLVLIRNTTLKLLVSQRLCPNSTVRVLYFYQYPIEIQFTELLWTQLKNRPLKQKILQTFFLSNFPQNSNFQGLVNNDESRSFIQAAKSTFIFKILQCMRITKTDKIDPPGYAVAVCHDLEELDVVNFASKSDILKVCLIWNNISLERIFKFSKYFVTHLLFL